MVLTMLGGCGEDEPIADPPPTTTTPRATEPNATEPPATDVPGTSTTTVASPSDDEAEVRAVIDRYWDAWFDAAGNRPDPDHEALQAVLSGEAAQRIIGGIERWRDNGEYVRLPAGSVFRSTVESVTFDERGVATVRECVADDSEVVNAATGDTTNSGLAALVVESTVAPFDSGWRITTRITKSRTPGASTCDG